MYSLGSDSTLLVGFIFMVALAVVLLIAVYLCANIPELSSVDEHVGSFKFGLSQIMCL